MASILVHSILTLYRKILLYLYTIISIYYCIYRILTFMKLDLVSYVCTVYIYTYGVFLTHGDTPKSFKSLDYFSIEAHVFLKYFSIFISSMYVYIYIYICRHIFTWNPSDQNKVYLGTKVYVYVWINLYIK